MFPEDSFSYQTIVPYRDEGRRRRQQRNTIEEIEDDEDDNEEVESTEESVSWSLETSGCATESPALKVCESY